MRSVFLFVILMLPVSTKLMAQDAFEQFKKQQSKEFQAFKDARDREFASMLDEAWQFMNRKEGIRSYAKPKPEAVPAAPIAKPEPVKIKTTGEIRAPKTNSVATAAPTRNEPVPTTVPQGLDLLSVSAYGLENRYPYDPVWKSVKLGSRTEAGIKTFFTELATSRFEPAVAAIKNGRTALNMNDWAVGVSVERFTQTLHSGRDEQLLLTWFLLAKAGYAIRIGYNNAGICLMIPSGQQLFAAPYFELESKRFYVLQFTAQAPDPGAIYTYGGAYPNANGLFDFSLDSLPIFETANETRELKFTWNTREYLIPVHYNRNAVAFMASYPQVDLPFYFTAKASQTALTSLMDGLKPLLEGKTELESINLILRFVQTAFAYKTDEDQFGKEKYLFVEETLHYPFSDCEDRSILFAFLVRNLLGNEVIGLKYPGHLATAVVFKSVPKGDGFEYEGKTYTVCDPTYVNADAGMTMPDFRNESPAIVRFKNG